MIRNDSKLSSEAMVLAGRKELVAEIRILRKFEGRSLIDERIARGMEKLHMLWYSPQKAR